jgi:hypothetical protein
VNARCLMLLDACYRSASSAYAKCRPASVLDACYRSAIDGSVLL